MILIAADILSYTSHNIQSQTYFFEFLHEAALLFFNLTHLLLQELVLPLQFAFLLLELYYLVPQLTYGSIGHLQLLHYLSVVCPHSLALLLLLL